MLEQRVSTIDVPRDMPSWAALVPGAEDWGSGLRAVPFQRELYAQATDDRELVVMKGTQLGISTWALRWIIGWRATAEDTAAERLWTPTARRSNGRLRSQEPRSSDTERRPI